MTEDRKARFTNSNEPTTINLQPEREKILTMKYGKHQMMLIRKRLRVEMWVVDQLEELYSDQPEKDAMTEFDLDELLDLASQREQRQCLQNKLLDCSASPVDVEFFINGVVERLTTL